MIKSDTSNGVYQFMGLSTDEKPLNDTVAPSYNKINKFIGNGSIFFEMDTSKVFMFDEQNNKWLEI